MSAGNSKSHSPNAKSQNPPNILSAGGVDADVARRKSNNELVPPGMQNEDEDNNDGQESRRESAVMTAEEERRALAAFNSVATNRMIESIDGVPVFREMPIQKKK